MKAFWEAMAVTPWEVPDLDRWTEKALEKGATALVVRLARPPSYAQLWAWARRWEGVPWLVHARWATQPLGWGMHFPAPPTSPPPKPAPTYYYGQSCHTPEEVKAAAPWATYVWIGSFFETPSHPGKPTLRLELLTALRATYPDLPLVAIGGISRPEQIAAVRQAGASGFAAIRYFL
ncbi:MAG: thiamine phosphate synthase [Bacteroidia bacterium]|jgi:thiamine monophosphate synthase|nr:thiamine phosphate synthase [Bacteroidia bacterium]